MLKQHDVDRQLRRIRTGGGNMTGSAEKHTDVLYTWGVQMLGMIFQTRSRLHTNFRQYTVKFIVSGYPI